MSLRVVHINNKEAEIDQAAKYLWEEVLKPKWERKRREEAMKKYPKAFLVEQKLHA